MSSSYRSGRPSVAPRNFNSAQDENFIYECKAAYLVIFDDLDDEITSEDELFRALQQAGRNPSKKTMRKYWTRNTESMTFRDFCDVCRKEPATSEDELMKAFKKIDANGDGYLSNKELRNVLTTKGEKMTTAEVAAIIDEVDENKDGKLDYREFCTFVLKTQEDAKMFALKNMEKKLNKKGVPRRGSRMEESSSYETKKQYEKEEIEKSKPREPSENEDSSDSDIVISSHRSVKSNSSQRTGEKPKPQPRKRSTYSETSYGGESLKSTREISKLAISSKSLRLSVPKNIKEWQKAESRGCFFFDEDSRISSHQYNLDLPEDSSVWLTINPISITNGDLNSTRGDSTSGLIDTMLFVLRDDRSLVTFTEQRDSRGKYGVRCDLKRGSYKLIPFTTGCRFRRRTSEPDGETKLIKKVGDKYILTQTFKEALGSIFDMCDLDGDGYMSREEFSWFNMRTSGEEVNDEEWEVVEENVSLHKGKLTKDGFIELNQMEADDNEGDTEDLWVTLNSMGFNKRLHLDEACVFNVEAFAEDTNVELNIVGLNQGGRSFERVIVESTMSKGEASKVKGSRDLTLYTYSNDFRACLVVENKSSNKVNLNLDCSRSKNCVSNRRNMNFTVDVPGKSVMVGHHLMPKKESQDWGVKTVENIVT